MHFIQERIEKLTQDLNSLIHKEKVSLTGYKYRIVSEPIHDFHELDTADWNDFAYAMSCGGNNDYYYFSIDIEIPETFAGEPVLFLLESGGGSKWDTTSPQYRCYVNGTFVQGLDENHESILLTEDAKAGENYRIILGVYTGTHTFQTSLRSSIAILDRATEKYYYDIVVPLEVAKLLDKEDKEYIEIVQSLNESLNLLDLRKPGSKQYYQSLEQAQQYLDREFYEKRCGDQEAVVYCVGHTHIDIAWLWTLEVAKDKAVRSFGTVIQLMKEYPEYIFMSSQPHLYKAIKEREPELYDAIKQEIAAGRWEPEGGMFVEADCNLTSGESLVRQILYGKRFFQKEFQKDNELLWLPDVFGYSAAMPQILQKSGIKYFMTTKISWNEFNKLPYDTFLWEGIDGSKVLTHFIPASDYDINRVRQGHFTTYNGKLGPSQIKGAWQRYQQKYLNDEVLMAFGYGDGGGGPTKKMLEHQRRLSKGIPGAPKTIMATARDFFEVLESKVMNSKHLPEWSGELYLEYHRGTYTSMARNKKYNRKSEFLMNNLELYSTLEHVLCQKAYPQEELNAMWEVVLRNQFHDILPGSSIKEVYETSKEEYDQLLESGNQYLDQLYSGLTEQINASQNSVIVYNPNGFIANDYVEVQLPAGLEEVTVTDGVEIYPYQKVEDKRIIFYAKNVPSKGYRTFYLEDKPQSSQTMLNVTTKVMENDFIRIELNEKGQFSSIYDKTRDREVLKAGCCGNVLMTYEDRPHKWDAWDVNNYYLEKSWEVDEVSSIEVIEVGNVRACLKVVRNYLDSTITQYIYIYRDSSRIDIKNIVDWKEEHILLRVLFPVDIHANEATFDIQFGNVKRPTHYNTSWDYARFEVCHHKWLDISEDDYGVSLLNDCKYGCNVHNGTIGLSLIKSATSPNPDADKEIHEFTYSLFPHSGDWKSARTINQANLLNNPLVAKVKKQDGGCLPETYSFVTLNAENVILDTVKKAEDSNDIIIRVFESFNRRTNVTMKFENKVESIVECDLMEDDLAPVRLEGAEAHFTIQPYEIKTFKVRMQA